MLAPRPSASLNGVNARSTIRASDSEREQVAERLRQAAVEGRLLAEELEHRLFRALRARTRGELDALVSDLPGKRAARAPRSLKATATQLTVLAIVLTTMVAIIGAIILFVTGLAFVWVSIWVAWMLLGRRRHCSARHRSSAHLRYARRGLL